MSRIDRTFTVIGYILVLVALIYFAGHVGIAVLR